MATTALLEEVYRHWGAGDWSPRFPFYADDMEWGWSWEFPEFDGVFADDETPNSRLARWLGPWETWRCEAEAFVESGESVVALTRYRGRGLASGAEVDVQGAHVWTFRDGQAVRLEIFADRYEAFRSTLMTEAAVGC